MSKKALIAMSGGVDSSVAAYLMKQQGFDCVGASMKLIDMENMGLSDKEACGSKKDVEDACAVAQSLGIPFYVCDFAHDFKEQVICRFVEGYQNGATPNPCVECNRYMKFGKLITYAKQLGMDYVATGHYARVEYDASAGRYLLKKAVDEAKDQSYVLYSLTQDQLAHTLLPLGRLYKTEIRNIAVNQGFMNANKQDSQDICFIKDGDYAGFIEQFTGKKWEDGNFIDTQGNILGRHKGLIRYTIGQRKGLGLALERPMYVQSKNMANNTVTLCRNEELFSRTLEATDFNWIAFNKPASRIRVKAKIRYKHLEEWATVTPTGDNTVHIAFDHPQRAIAKGQAVVLYDGNIVIGGGTIEKVPSG